ncbi:MAG: DUF3108 domain-containing protein [Geminicoccaceae bacterium]
MTKRRLSARMALLGALVLPLLAGGRSFADDKVKVEYSIQLGSVEVGKAELEQRPGGDRVKSQFELRTGGGLLGLLQEKTSSELEGTTLHRDGQAVPSEFHAEYKKPDRKREITMRYDDGGAVADFQYVNNGQDRDSDVPKDRWAETVDPLTALQRVQLWLAGGAKAKGEVLDIPVFDGRRRSDVKVRYLGRAQAQDGEGGGQVSALEVLIVGHEGFDEKDEFVTLADGGPEKWIDVRFSTDAMPVPLGGQVRTSRPPVTVTVTDRD